MRLLLLIILFSSCAKKATYFAQQSMKCRMVTLSEKAGTPATYIKMDTFLIGFNGNNTATIDSITFNCAVGTQKNETNKNITILQFSQLFGLQAKYELVDKTETQEIWDIYKSPIFAQFADPNHWQITLSKLP